MAKKEKQINIFEHRRRMIDSASGWGDESSSSVRKPLQNGPLIHPMGAKPKKKKKGY